MKSKKISRSLYSAIHHWLKYHYGKATKCENEECSGLSKNYQWALLRNKEYEYERKNFFQLCRSCHTRYDFTEESIRKMKENSPNTQKELCINGHPLTEENVYHARYKNTQARHCKICKAKFRKNWQEKNVEKRKIYQKAWHRRRKDILSILTSPDNQ